MSDLESGEPGADDSVHRQYEAFPYPARDPRDEAKRLVTGSPSRLAEINHYLFAGARDFRQPFRALVAGGGTGDATVMLAQQLAELGPGEVVYLDISRASRAIAEARAKARSLTNIQFHTAAIEGLESLDLGRFDYIDCCGVLHHLADPSVGLDTLARQLAPGGGIGVMLYGTLGREGVYDLQALLRRLSGNRPLDRQIEIARRLLASLPPTNGFARNPFVGDHKRSDAELVDLLLHSRDRAYRVPEIASLAEQSGLRIVTFLPAARYRPESYVKDPKILEALADLGERDRAAVAETLAGNLKTHVAYLAPADSAIEARVARIGPGMAPQLVDQDPIALAKAVTRDLVLRTDVDGLKLRFPLPRLSPAILREIDGRRTIDEIWNRLHDRDGSLEQARYREQFEQLYEVLNGLNLLLLSKPEGFPPS